MARQTRRWHTDPVTVPAHRVNYTFADFLALEAFSNVKHEFLDGQIYGMAGGTPDHAALKAALTGLLFGQVRGGNCRVHDSDLRVRVLATGLVTYPDLTIVCGPRELDPADPNTVTNPALIVEVLSQSTEDYDRGDKFEHYKHITTLCQYVLVSQDRREVEVWTRRGEDWTRVVSKKGDRARLDTVGAELDVDELYDATAEPAA